MDISPKKLNCELLRDTYFILLICKKSVISYYVLKPCQNNHFGTALLHMYSVYDYTYVVTQFDQKERINVSLMLLKDSL